MSLVFINLFIVAVIIIIVNVIINNNIMFYIMAEIWKWWMEYFCTDMTRHHVRNQMTPEL